MKSLFSDKNEDWTENGNKISVELMSAVQPIVKKWVDAGYSVRHIQLILFHSVFEVGVVASIDKICGV